MTDEPDRYVWKADEDEWTKITPKTTLDELKEALEAGGSIDLDLDEDSVSIADFDIETTDEARKAALRKMTEKAREIEHEFSAKLAGKSPAELKRLSEHLAEDVTESTMTRTPHPTSIEWIPPMDVERWSIDDSMPDDTSDYVSYELDLDVELAEKVEKAIFRHIDERREQGYDPDVLVLGYPQYKTLYPYYYAEYDVKVEDFFSDYEVVLVPGPMIHAAIPNESMLHELIEQDTDD